MAVELGGGPGEGARAAALRLPAEPGVYRFRAASGEVLYLGRAVDLRRRVLSYWSALRDRQHLAPMVASAVAVEAVPCSSEHEAAWLERNLLERELPPWNLTAGGQEVPVHIALDDSGSMPRLVVAHQPPAGSGVRVFGPYLGGSRARRAVSALHRVFLIGYVGEELAGTARGMADVRGVRPQDRARVVSAVTAVLDGDPGPVARFRADLVGLRDAAADSLRFEQAARLQAEIEAADWLLDPQQVTQPGAGDHDVHGWAAGRLVGFQVRDGRVCGWTEQGSSWTAAAPLLRRSAARWQPFADRAAQLAGRLATPGTDSSVPPADRPPPGHR